MEQTGKPKQSASEAQVFAGDAPHIPVPWLLASGRRLFSILFLTLAVPLFLFFLIFSSQMQNYFKAQAIQKNGEMAKLGAEAVENYFSGLIDYIEIFSSRQLLRESVVKKDASTVRELLKEFVSTNSELDRAFVADAEGVELYDYPHDPEVIGINFSYRDWFKGVRLKGRAYVSAVYQRAASPQIYVVAIAMPIYLKDGSLIGYVVTQTPMTALTRVQPTAAETIHLIDHQGFLVTQTVTASGPPLSLMANPFVKKMMTMQRGSGEGLHPVTDVPAIISWEKVPITGWFVMVSQSTENVFATPAAVKKIVAALVIVAFFFMVGFGWLWLSLIHQYHRQRKQALDVVLKKTLELATAKAEMEQLEFFAFAATHDLQEPLHKIVTLASLLDCHNPNLDENAKKDLDRICQSAIHMREMMEQLRELCRVASPEAVFEEIDLNEVIREVLQELEIRINETKAQIEVGVLPTIFGNHLQMTQLFQNLISNALKFVAEGEIPRVKIMGRQLEKEEVEIKVEDEGIGFDEKYADQIFKPFQRLHPKDRYPGSGIGLALVHSIVVRHKGQIEVHSRPGEGTTFKVVLPAHIK